jgi:hypothetical protein
MIMIAGMGEMTPNWLWRQCMICLVFCKDCCQLSGRPPVKSGIPYTTWLRSAHEMWLLFHFKVCFVDFNVNHTYIIMWATTQANCRLCFCYYYTITIPNNIYIYTSTFTVLLILCYVHPIVYMDCFLPTKNCSCCDLDLGDLLQWRRNFGYDPTRNHYPNAGNPGGLAVFYPCATLVEKSHKLES